MKTLVGILMLAFVSSAALPAAAATPTVNGANVFAVPALVDAQSNSWTIVSGVVQMNGKPVGSNYNANLLLEYNSVFYHRNTINKWYHWNGSSWPETVDPRVISTNGASIGVGTDLLVDSISHVWTLAANGWAYRDGVRAGGNYNTILVVYSNGIIYCENSSHDWYEWNGAGWTLVPGDPRGPHLVQYGTYTSPVCPANNPGCTPPFVVNSSVTFTKATTKGNAVWVAVTVSDYAGSHAISVVDSQGNVYHPLNQLNDGSPGAQSVAQFYAADVAGGADTVTVQWSSDNYKGVVVAEIGGVTTTPLVGNSGRIQDGGITAGSNDVASNGISVGAAATPALVVSLTMDTNGGASDIGGTGFCAIPAGTGFVQVAQTWSFAAGGSALCNLGTLETRTVTAAGTVAGSFTTAHLADPYLTVAAIFH